MLVVEIAASRQIRRPEAVAVTSVVAQAHLPCRAAVDVTEGPVAAGQKGLIRFSPSGIETGAVADEDVGSAHFPQMSALMVGNG